MIRLLASFLLAAALSAPAAPALAGLEDFAPAPEQPLRMARSTSGDVIARAGGLSICTDGRVRDARRSRRLRGSDRDHQQRTALTTGGGQPLDPDVIPY